MPTSGKVCIFGNKVLLGDELVPATIVAVDGKIVEIHRGVTDPSLASDCNNVIDGGDLVIMPGIFDSHVHVNEPGRTDWEGFYTATRAAAAGGITSLIDMPLNSIPPTTTVDNLLAKHQAASGKCFVDVGFWGGVVPDNEDELRPLVDNGVVGFKCFLIHSGVDEFPSVDEDQVDLSLGKLKGTGSVLLFHAEVDVGSNPGPAEDLDPKQYDTFLKSRPPQMEQDAIELVAKMCRKHGNVRCHIVHLSAAGALDTIAKLKSEGYPLTVETCPHYLTLEANEIPDKETTFKCCPPIRDSENQDRLWAALKDGTIDLIVSDHSPCTAELKKPGVKDFMSAWGGISSVQFGLPLVWTAGRKRGFGIPEVSRLMSLKPAALAGMCRTKGQIALGFDADFVIWDPEAEVQIEEASILHRNKLTPYKGKTVFGKTIKTVLRGRVIYDEGKFEPHPIGEFLVPNRLEAKILKEIKVVHLVPS